MTLLDTYNSCLFKYFLLRARSEFNFSEVNLHLLFNDPVYLLFLEPSILVKQGKLLKLKAIEHDRPSYTYNTVMHIEDPMTKRLAAYTIREKDYLKVWALIYGVGSIYV